MMMIKRLLWLTTIFAVLLAGVACGGSAAEQADDIEAPIPVSEATTIQMAGEAEAPAAAQAELQGAPQPTVAPVEAEAAPPDQTAPQPALEESSSEGMPPEEAIAEAPAPPAGGQLTPELLRNATYQSDWTDSGLAPLDNGFYAESIVPGAATQIEIQATDFFAFGKLNGDEQQDAAIVLVTNPGGSGSFFDLAAVINRNGVPNNPAIFPLGDRVQINSVAIENGEIIVDMITHGPDDPMCCPTQAVTKRFRLQALVEQEVSSPTEAPVDAGPPDPVGTYFTSLPAAVSPGVEITLELGEDGRATMTSNYLNGQAIIVETGTWRTEENRVIVQLTSLNGRPIDQEITFELQDGSLVATAYDQTIYGTTGLLLTRQ